jgi:hypothetical protein
MIIVLLKSNNLSNNISIMVNSTIKKTVRGGDGNLHDLINNMIGFVDISLEDDLYDMTIYGQPLDIKTQRFNLGLCILQVLVNGIDQSKEAISYNEERFKTMIHIINSFIKEFNKDNDENINNISLNINTNAAGVVTISNEQKRQVLNLINNQKFKSIISNITIAADYKADTNEQTKQIAKIKRFQESFKQELMNIKAE